MTELRAASPADARTLADLLYAFNVEFDTPTPQPDVLAERLATLLGRDDMAALLIGDSPKGFALMTFRPSVWDAGPVCLLEELYVQPERRGQGLGTQLLHRAFAVAREHGSETFEVNVDEEDVDAQRFYERHGVSRSALYFERSL